MRIQYIGKSGNDLTNGFHYEAESTASAANVNITADDAGDEHCIPKHDCVVLDDRPAPVDPVFDPDIAWEDGIDEGIPDPADYLAPGIQVIARDLLDAPPEPDGPKSTGELRKYRFKPEIY